VAFLDGAGERADDPADDDAVTAAAGREADVGVSPERSVHDARIRRERLTE
jgi:hypothetical protein